MQMIGCVYGIYLWVMIRMLPFGPQLRWNITIHKVPHSAITIHSCSRTLPKPGADMGEIDHEKAEKASVGDARLTEVMLHPRPDGQVVTSVEVLVNWPFRAWVQSASPSSLC